MTFQPTRMQKQQCSVMTPRPPKAMCDVELGRQRAKCLLLNKKAHSAEELQKWFERSIVALSTRSHVALERLSTYEALISEEWTSRETLDDKIRYSSEEKHQQLLAANTQVAERRRQSDARGQEMQERMRDSLGITLPPLLVAPCISQETMDRLMPPKSYQAKLRRHADSELQAQIVKHQEAVREHQVVRSEERQQHALQIKERLAKIFAASVQQLDDLARKRKNDESRIAKLQWRKKNKLRAEAVDRLTTQQLAQQDKYISEKEAPLQVEQETVAVV